MSATGAFDEILTPQELELFELHKAVSEADLKRIAKHLRRPKMPYRFVLEAIADMLDPLSPLRPDQTWRLERKRLRRGKPTGNANTMRRRIALYYHKEELKHLAHYKSERGLTKRVTSIVAERHGVDEKTVRNSLGRLKFSIPRNGR
jgi:hypothetical protein